MNATYRTPGKRVTLGSIVRSGAKYLDRYFAQLNALGGVLEGRGASLHNVIVEGDSNDDTWFRLVQYYSTPGPLTVRLIKYEHGGAAYGSVDKPDRWANIARTWNHMFSRIRETDRDLPDVFVYMEADLIWEAYDVVQLIDHVLDGVDAVAPMSYIRGVSPPMFWDTWGHRAGGVHFRNTAPFHAWLDPRKVLPPGVYDRERGLIKIDSAGSCGVFKGEVIKRCSFDPRDAMIGKSLHEEGFTFWLDPMVQVLHPNIYGGDV